MRIILLLCSALFASLLSYAQPPEQPASGPQRENAIDRMQNGRGIIVQKEITEIGDLKNLKIQLVTAINTSSEEQRVFYGRLVYDYKDINSPDVKGLYLDMMGVDDLKHDFNNLQSNILPKKSNTYTEFSFKTVDGIIGGCYWTREGWSIYMKLVATEPSSYVSFTPAELTKFLASIDFLRSKMLAAPLRK